MKLRASTAALAAMFGLAIAAPAMAQQAPPDHPGRGVYNKACATCHDKPVDPRAATLASIQQQAPARLREVLTTGVMAPMAAGLARRRSPTSSPSSPTASPPRPRNGTTPSPAAPTSAR